MTADTITTLFIGLAGAIIGAGASIITVWVQAKIQDRREKLRLAMESAWRDFENDRALAFEVTKRTNKSKRLTPIVVYLHYHIKLMGLLESGQHSKEDFAKLRKENKEVIELLKMEETQ